MNDKDNKKKLDTLDDIDNVLLAILKSVNEDNYNEEVKRRKDKPIVKKKLLEKKKIMNRKRRHIEAQAMRTFMNDKVNKI